MDLKASILSDRSTDLKDHRLNESLLTKEQQHEAGLIQEFGEDGIYNLDYLKEGSQNKEYLDIVSKKGPLDKMFKIVDIAVSDQNLMVCPVLIELKDPELIKIYKCKYRLQVWKQGKVIYTKPLGQKVRLWGITSKSNTLFFVLDRKDEPDGKDYIHMVELTYEGLRSSRESDEKKILDWTGILAKEGLGKQVSFGITDDNILMMENSNEIHGVKIDSLEVMTDVENEETYYRVHDHNILQVGAASKTGRFSMPEGQIIQVLMDDGSKTYNDALNEDSHKTVAAITTEDLQIDFSEVHITQSEDEDNSLVIEFRQIQELVARRKQIPQDDAIINFIPRTLKGGKKVYIVQRKSNNVDFYWNYKIVFSSDRNDEKFGFELQEMTFDELIIKKWERSAGDGTRNKNYCSVIIALSQEHRISLNDALETKLLSDEECVTISASKIKDHYKPYESIFMYQDYIFAAHDNLLSIWNRLEKRWLEHISFAGEFPGTGVHVHDDNAQQLEKTVFGHRNTLFMKDLQSKKVISVFKQTHSDGNIDIAVLFQDGTFTLLICNEDESEILTWEQEHGVAAMEGTIFDMSYDFQHHRIMYILTKDDEGKVRLYGFIENDLYEVVDKDCKLTDDTEVIHLFSDSANSDIIMIDKNTGELRIMEYSLEKNDSEPEKLSIQMKLIKKWFDPNLSKNISKGRVHAAVTTDKEDHVMLVNDKDCIVYDFKNLNKKTGNPNMIKHNNINLTAVSLIDGRYMYCIVNNSETSIKSYFYRSDRIAQAKEAGQEVDIIGAGSNSGFSVVDLAGFKDDQRKRFRITNIYSAIAGVNNSLVFSEKNQRFLFLSNYDEIQSMPVLHQNCNNFFGMRRKTQYLSFKRIKDTFIALDKMNVLHSWSMLSGDYLGNVTIYDEDFREYEVWDSPNQEGCLDREKDLYRKGHFNHSLLYKREADPDMTDDLFYGDRLKNHFGGIQASYLRNLKKTFHQMKVIEIISPTKVAIHIQFIFPRFIEFEQHLFFSTKFNRMLELTGKDNYLYKVKAVNAEQKKVKVSPIRKLVRLPKNLIDGDAFSLYCMFSPSLKRCIDLDLKSEQFVIRNMLTGHQDGRIPTEFFQSGTDLATIIKQVKFITWEDETHLRMIDIHSSPPLEAVIDTSQLELTYSEMITPCSVTSMPLLDFSPYEVDLETMLDNPGPGGNFFKDDIKCARNEKITRLERMQQRITREMVNFESGRLGQGVAANWHRNTSLKGKAWQNRINDTLYSVDYTGDEERVFLETPFSWLDWYEADRMYLAFSKGNMKGKDYKETEWAKIPSEMMKGMTLNCFPYMNSVYHIGFDCYDFVKFVTEMARADNPNYEIPFQLDFNGDTALALAVFGKRANQNVANYFLTTLLINLPMGNSSTFVATKLAECVRKGVPGVAEYINSRMFTTRQLSGCSKFDSEAKHEKVGFWKSIKESIKAVFADDVDATTFVNCLDLWPDKRQVFSNVLNKSPIKTESVIEFFDLPKIFNPHPLQGDSSDDFISALVQTADYDLIKCPPIAQLINFRWGLTKKFVTSYMLLPYICFFLVYVFQVMLQFDPNKHYLDDTDPDTPGLQVNVFPLVVTGFILICCIYFVLRSLTKLSKYKLAYFSDVWNYIDVLPPMMIITVVALDFVDQEGRDWLIPAQIMLQAISAFFMWLKIFFFLRLFKQTGFFVHMLLKVFAESKNFLFMYALINMAFACAFYICTDGEQFTMSTYMIGMGEYDTEYDGFEAPGTLFVLFLLTTIMINIVMLNLLIAIVSEAYTQVNKERQEANDFERISLIDDNSKLISSEKKANRAGPSQYMVIAKALSKK